MLSIQQTTFNGIDDLNLTQINKPALTNNGVLIKMDLASITPTDIKREINPNATKESLAELPRTIGFSGTGTVVEVGNNRDQSLFDQRVFIMQPTGSYSDYVLSENSDWIFPLPDNVDNASATTLTATPFVLLNSIKKYQNAGITDFILTGANSVIGQYLLQLIDPNENIHIYPIVSSASKDYFSQQFPNLPSHTADTLPSFNKAAILDIAGSTALISRLVSKISSPVLTSIALMSYEDNIPFQFVHEEFDRAVYQNLIQKLADRQIFAPIDRIFSATQIKEAQHYTQDNHSRGRVLVSFN